MELLKDTHKITTSDEWKIILFIRHLKTCFEHSIIEKGMKECYTIKELSSLLDMDISHTTKAVRNLDDKGLIRVINNNNIKVIMIE